MSKMVLLSEPHTFGSKPVQVPRRFADLGCFPRRFEQLPFSKTDEDWIESAGLQSRVAADVVSVYPVLRGLEKSVEHLEGLWRQAQFHLMKSTYVDIGCQQWVRRGTNKANPRL